MSLEDKYVPITLKNIEYKNIVVINVPPDGSCFFHAILRAFSKDYITSNKENRIIQVKKFRILLAIALSETDPKTGIRIYDQLSGGEYAKFAKELKSENYTLETLQNELLSDEWASDSYLELVSELLFLDIYIIDEKTQDVYSIPNNFKLLHKGRNSIIILYKGDHYDVIGLKGHNGRIDSFFQASHPLIQVLKERYIKLRKN